LQGDQALDYDPQPKGILSAREAVVRYYSEQHSGLELDPESVVLTTSTSEAYSYIFRLLCNPGDEVLIAKPSYPLFDFLADLQDVKLVPYTLIYDHGWQIDFPSLSGSVTSRTRAAVLVHPNNPTGSHVSATERDLLNGFCRERGLALIVDEVFLDYPHNGEIRPTFAANQEVLTFTLSGLSKISALPQMKAAWLIVSGPTATQRMALERLEMIADTFLSMSAPIQLALPTLLNYRRNIQPALMERVSHNLRVLDHQILSQKSCTCLDVQAGWYAVLRIPAIQSDEETAIEILRKQSVLVHPGHFFDFPNDGFLILSLITPPEQFKEGIRRVLALLNR
ncbi:MAG: pyridoxal phosphate-dependent aminotransferase, partial [Acidobacteriota bacterium]|nr:pyridoxal phosphate-dependent aminotransferase [Acidobacteriota bacterium]